MGARPVDLFAARAPAELFVIDLRKRLELLDDVGFGCIFQSRVAAKTARKRSDQVQKIKTADDLNRLFFGVWERGQYPC
jgi:hypothetical protein